MRSPHRTRRGWLAALALPLCAFADRGGPDAPLLALREVPAPALPAAGEANLTVGPGGRVYLSWIDPLADSGRALRFAVLGRSAWSAPRLIAAGRDWFVNWADFPSLVALSDRELAAHWLVRRAAGHDYDIVVARSRDGGRTWGGGTRPYRDEAGGEHGFVSMWPDSTGRVGIVWLDGRKTAAAEAARRRGDSTVTAEMALRQAFVGVDGRAGAETELDGRTCDCCQTGAAMTADGPIVVYRDRTAGEVRDISVVRRVHGAWTAPAPVAADGWRINACPVNGPAVAAEGRRVVVAWFTGAHDARHVKVAFSADAGATFGAPVVVDDGRPVGRVAVALLDGGAALVSWLEEAGGDAEVRVRRVEAGGVPGPSMTIAATGAARPSGFPRMVRAGDRVVFAWRDPETGVAPRVHTAVARLPGERR